MTSVPLVNLPRQYQKLRSEIDGVIGEVCAAGQFVLGQRLEDFEQAFARYLGSRHCIGVGSGTDALHLILRALGIGAGDEVILPANTFIATAQAVWACGARPVLADCDVRTATIDVESAAAALTNRTRAIIPVHLFGQPADVDSIAGLAGRHGIHVIEDTAQAHGAEYKGRKCGTLGVAAAFSFYPGKNLGGYGDGGAITTNDDALAAELRLLRNLGSSTKYVHRRMGFNSRLDVLQAAILHVKLRYLDEWNDRRHVLASRYRAALAPSAARLQPIDQAPWTSRHAYHLFVVRSLSGERDRIVQHLQSRGIGAGIHYPIPIHHQEAFGPLMQTRPALPVAERLASEVFSLPLCPELLDTEADRVVEEVQSALRSSNAATQPAF